MAATAALTSNAISISRAEDGDDKDTGEEVEDFVEIDRLEQLGINRGDIKKAKDSGFATCESLMMNCKKDLVAIKGLSEAKIDKMMEAARQLCKTASWMTASVYSAWRDSTIMKISTGAAALDQVLGGGFETKSITELYGEHRTGKTQICHTLCVTSQMPQECGGGAGKVAYLDAEGTFRPERIRPIAERFGLDPDAVLENILCARSFTFEHLFDLLVAVAAKMAEEGTYKVLIVDSIIAHLRVDFSGRGELAERQQVLGKLLNRLKKISEEFNVAVIITNHVMADPSGGAVFVVDAKKPIGGHVLAHAATFRISLRKGKAEQRIAKVVDAPNLAEAEAVFQVAVNGISNFQD